MDAQGSWRVASLSPSRREDYLAFFDHERGRAFADNPAWAGCYCHFCHAAPALDWSSLPADANRTAIGARIEVGEMEGFLAHALASFAERGIRVVDAFPDNSTDAGAAAQFRGPLRLYERSGFSRIAEHGHPVAMRKILQ